MVHVSYEKSGAARGSSSVEPRAHFLERLRSEHNSGDVPQLDVVKRPRFPRPHSTIQFIASSECVLDTAPANVAQLCSIRRHSFYVCSPRAEGLADLGLQRALPWPSGGEREANQAVGCF